MYVWLPVLKDSFGPCLLCDILVLELLLLDYPNQKI